MELSLFSYEPQNSPLTKVPPGIKLILLLVLIILSLYLNLRLSIALFFTLLFIAFLLGFSFKSQIQDFKPILIYIIFFYFISVFLNLFQTKTFSIDLLIPTSTILLSITRLLITVQLASLFYKTTSRFQLKFSLEQFEFFLRRLLRKLPFFKEKIGETPSIAFIFSLVITFIPRIITLWNQLKLAWLSRGGTSGLPMIAALFPQLLSLAFTDAENTWQAILCREKEID